MDIVDWLDAQGTPEAHSARDEIERLRAEVAALKAPVGMEPVAWQAYSGRLAYSKTSFMPGTRDLAVPLYSAAQLAQVQRERDEAIQAGTLAKQMKRIAALEAKCDAYKKDAERYAELIMSIERKFPGESRHETALKYIRYCEAPSETGAAMQKEKE